MKNGKSVASSRKSRSQSDREDNNVTNANETGSSGASSSGNPSSSVLKTKTPFKTGAYKTQSDIFHKQKSASPTARRFSADAESLKEPRTGSDESGNLEGLLIDVRRSKLSQSDSQHKSNLKSSTKSPLSKNSVAGTSASDSGLPFTTSNQNRRPFSFSKDETLPPPKGDSHLFKPTQNLHQRRMHSVDGSGDHGQVFEVRSPRVRFADEEVQRLEESYADLQSDNAISKMSNSETEDTSSNNTTTESSPSPEFTPWPNKLLVVNYNVNDSSEETNLKEPERSSSFHSLSPNSPKNSKSDDLAIIEETDNILSHVSQFIHDMKNEGPKFDANSEGNSHYAASERSLPHPFSQFLVSSSRDQSKGNILTDRSILGSTESIWSQGTIGERRSRPNSASSFIRSVSNEDIHGRIQLTLRMIEQEEERERSKAMSYSYPDMLQSLECEHILRQHFSPKLKTLDTKTIETSDIQQPQRQSPSPRKQTSAIAATSQVSPDNRTTPSPRTSLPTTQSSRIESTVSLNPSHTIIENSTTPRQPIKLPPSSTSNFEDSSGEKTRKLFSFLDEVEKTDLERLHAIELGGISRREQRPGESSASVGSSEGLPFLQKVDNLLRKGSVELAKEHIILERKLEETNQRVLVLEETLLHQRELNMRNIRNSERDLAKRLKLQKEEFDVAFARNESLINEMVAEKRILQERCDKLMRSFDETESKYKEQIKNLQQKHLEDIKRLRKTQISVENSKKQQWMGQRTQEIRDMTVKGLEPEVQRIIQRHQQEMNELRAWHSDETREIEERYQRKFHMQVQELRDNFGREAEEDLCREKEAIVNKFELILKQREEEFDMQVRKFKKDLQDERESSQREVNQVKETMRESVRRAEIKGEVELNNLKQDYESKISSLEKRHSNELHSLRDVHGVEMDTLRGNLSKKLEMAVKEKEATLTETLRASLDMEMKEKERKLKIEFERLQKEEEANAEIRLKRLQDKLGSDIQEMDQAEKELKLKFNQAKSQLLATEEEIYSLKTSLTLKEKHNSELQDANTKMLEERANLNAIIKREFFSQIEALEGDVNTFRTALVELETKQKLELEQKQHEFDKVCNEKDAEVDKIGVRVQQTIARKDETILGLQKQIEKCSFQIKHLEGLLEEQRKNIVDSLTKPGTTTTGKRPK